MHKGLDIPPHNQFLSHMIDHGLLGLMILPLLLLALIWRTEGDSRRVTLVFSGTALWFSFFTHQFIQTPHSLLLVALVAALSSTGVRLRDKANQGRMTANSDWDHLTKALAHSDR